MRLPLYVLLFSFLLAIPASAQFAAQKDARNIAVLRAVVNYKIDDEENIKAIEKLRQDRNFNQRLQRMLNKLTNKRTKDSTNRKVNDILEKAGEDLYNLLN